MHLREEEKEAERKKVRMITLENNAYAVMFKT